MTHPKARARALAIMLGCVALTALFFAGTASAASRGYTLHNSSSHTLELVDASPLPATVCNGFICVQTHHPMKFEGRPDDGSTIKPGAKVNWELKYGFQETYAAELKYKILGTSSIVTYTIETSTFTNNSACKVTPPSVGKCTAGGLSIGFANG
ncbi:MAG TPA: hypothetical protein VN671_08965 [Solirubrobacterales bacterium]|nr:hypothetical protein [Solirubrobacterales bacterium]